MESAQLFLGVWVAGAILLSLMATVMMQAAPKAQENVRLSTPSAITIQEPSTGSKSRNSGLLEGLVALFALLTTPFSSLVDKVFSNLFSNGRGQGESEDFSLFKKKLQERIRAQQILNQKIAALRRKHFLKHKSFPLKTILEEGDEN